MDCITIQYSTEQYSTTEYNADLGLLYLFHIVQGGPKK